MLLITGGLGFVGAHTVRAALDADGVCVTISRASRPLPPVLAVGASKPIVEKADARDSDSLVDLGRRHPITGIIHLAAAAIDTPPLEQIEQNVRSLTAVVRAATALGVRRVTVASSIGVYAGVRDASAPLTEDTPLPPVGLHGIQASKKILEITGDLASRGGDVEVVAVRIPAVWGPGGHASSRFFDLPQLVHAAVRGETLPEVVADAGIESVYARDAGSALVAVQTSDALRQRLYNLGSGVTTNAEVVDALCSMLPDKIGRFTESADVPAPVALDTSRLREDTSWTHAFDLTSGIRDYVTWLGVGHER